MSVGACTASVTVSASRWLFQDLTRVLDSRGTGGASNHLQRLLVRLRQLLSSIYRWNISSATIQTLFQAIIVG